MMIWRSSSLNRFRAFCVTMNDEMQGRSSPCIEKGASAPRPQAAPAQRTARRAVSVSEKKEVRE